MHELSTGTWLIHISTVLEWGLAILIISKIGTSLSDNGYKFFALAMLPNLASAMAAITWHIFDNDPQLVGLVFIQALLTFIGNICLAAAAWNLTRGKNQLT